MRIFPVLLALVLSVPPAFAGASDWVEIAPDTRVRLISTDVRAPDGSTVIAVDLEMPAGTKTYWRNPGETGIPAQFDLSGSDGVGSATVKWPYPLIEVTDDYTDFVHYGHVVIPLHVAVTGERPMIDMALTMGICSEICVPAMTRLRLELDFIRPDVGQKLRIDQALANVPLTWTGPAEAIGNVTYDAADELLRVSLDPAVIDPSSLLAEPFSAPYAIGAPQKSPEHGIVTLPAIGSLDSGIEGDVRFTFMAADGPYELIRSVKPSTER